MSVFFIADTHFGHTNIIEYENRPFQSVKDMNEHMIRSWNGQVNHQDKVFFLGDFGIGDKEYLSQIVVRLKGRKHMIMGNHDKGRTVKWWLDAGFHEVSEFPIIYKDFYMLSHEPLYVNRNMPYANIFGHVHSNPAYQTCTSQTYCVSTERLNYKPIDFETLKKEIMEHGGNNEK